MQSLKLAYIVSEKRQGYGLGWVQLNKQKLINTHSLCMCVNEGKTITASKELYHTDVYITNITDFISRGMLAS